MPTLAFVFVAILVVLTLLSFASVYLRPKTPLQKPKPVVRVLSADPDVPPIPQTAQQAHKQLRDDQFELFSAAVIIGLGEGHMFLRHVGGKGDRGVDTHLLNAYGKLVLTQSKRFASRTTTVPPKDVRDFSGAIHNHRAVYGYFITTSTFTKQSKEEARSSRGTIILIDGPRLDQLLQTRYREIALTYQDILNTVQ